MITMMTVAIMENMAKSMNNNEITIGIHINLIKVFKHIDFCGQISDPIFNPNFITFLSMCRDADSLVRRLASWSLQQW